MVQVLVFSDFGHVEEKDGEKYKSLPKSVWVHVPHLLIKHVQLLKSLKVVVIWGCICNGPQPKVMHVCQKLPAMLERNLLSFLQELIIVLGLSVASGDATEISELLLSGLKKI